MTIFISACIFNLTSCQTRTGRSDLSDHPPGKTILIYGNGINQVYIRYIMELTGKKDPRICFIPTAAADDRFAIQYWHKFCEELSIEPVVLRTFISSSPEQKTFEEEILSSDAIIVGGGNTLNMLAIWKAQGIDTVLKKAYDKGIILAGGSAGSLCWSTGGYSDSRPVELSIIECLGFLDYSHCPHYNSESARRPLYLEAVRSGKLKPGYACDDDAGLLFINGKVAKSLSLNSENHNYFVSVKEGKIIEEKLPCEILK